MARPKLTDDEVATLREMFAAGFKQAVLARGFDLSRPQVHRLVTGQRRLLAEPARTPGAQQVVTNSAAVIKSN